MKIDEAMQYIQHRGVCGDKLFRDISARLVDDLDIMLQFENAGRYTEAKYVARCILRDVDALHDAIDCGAANEALSAVSATITRILEFPDSAESLPATISAIAAKYREGPERFPVGTRVRVGTLAQLEAFVRDWKFHNPLMREQLQFAGLVSSVRKVDYYGGDSLYYLEGTGSYIWQEECLTQCES